MLSRVIQKALSPVSVSYLVFGLEVPHAHIHLVPRFVNDNHPRGPNPERTMKLPSDQMEMIAKRIRESF